MEVLDYIGGICAASFLLIVVTIFYCIVTVKKEQKSRKIIDAIANSTQTTLPGTELTAMILNSRTTNTAQHRIESSTPYISPGNQIHCSAEYVLHDPSIRVVSQNTYENCSYI